MIVLTPRQLKDASVIDASPTPPTIGKREEITHIVGFCHIRMIRKIQLKTATKKVKLKISTQQR